MKLKLICCFVLFACMNSKAQQFLYPVDSVFLSGVVYDGDSVNTLPGAHLLFNHQPYSVTDFDGRFLIRMSRTDTLTISYLGFKEFDYVFPEKTFLDEYFIRVPLRRDSIVLAEVEIYPWPTKGAFKQAFLEAKELEQDRRPIPMAGVRQYEGPVVEPKA